MNCWNWLYSFQVLSNSYSVSELPFLLPLCLPYIKSRVPVALVMPCSVCQLRLYTVRTNSKHWSHSTRASGSYRLTRADSAKEQSRVGLKLAAFTLLKPKLSFHCIRERRRTDQNEREIHSQPFSLQRPRDRRPSKESCSCVSRGRSIPASHSEFQLAPGS